MDKLLQLISLWKKIFEPTKDLLPYFFDFYNKILNKGIEFPPAYESKYSKYQRKKPKRDLPEDVNFISFSLLSDLSCIYGATRDKLALIFLGCFISS